MLKLISAPATNERGPRYMEKALAAIHQANALRSPMSLEHGLHEGRVALFVRSLQSMEEIVTGPIVANYPNCLLTSIERDEPLEEEPLPAGWETWTAELALVPELFPILRHAQFEDMLNRNFADPVSGILRAIKPDEHLRCRVEITITPTSAHRCHWAVRAVKRLDREFFHQHHRLARYYAKHITHSRRLSVTWLVAWLLGLIAKRTAEPVRTSLETSTSRVHEREDDLQAASDKIGGHLFDARIRLIVATSGGHHAAAIDRIHQMAGAFGAFTKSRLAKFRLGPMRRETMSPIPAHGRGPVRGPSQGHGFLLSHEELATLWHPPTATALAEQMQTAEFTELEAPGRFYSGRETGAVTVGRFRFREDRRAFGIGQEDRRRHLYIVGKTGMGKWSLNRS